MVFPDGSGKIVEALLERMRWGKELTAIALERYELDLKSESILEACTNGLVVLHRFNDPYGKFPTRQTTQ